MFKGLFVRIKLPVFRGMEGVLFMFYKSLKDLIKNLNSENVEKLKPQLNRYVNQLILSIYDTNLELSDLDLESLCETLLHKDEFREEFRDKLQKGLLIDKFIHIYDLFINEITKERYVFDGIELTTLCLRSIGGIARGLKLLKLNKHKEEYFHSLQYLKDLNAEFYAHLRQYAGKGIIEEHFLITGLIHTIRFYLEENCQEHGRKILALLTDRKDKRLKTLEEFNNELHTAEIKCMLTREYAIELQRRLYLWDKLTIDLKNHYYLENLYLDDLERTASEING
ncbi:hypothetical protein cpu_15590 [Carboxydothermus pertinax]|uniref:Uncharacterized protein n=2 Tax=Carboxydothermus pertinax TaxID=870242 RepID=A0A1L8CW18_9THEO|nr:hypothetical protein cpu_15590 [Carboxydothermus pertinax]